MPPCPEETPVWLAGEFWNGYATCASCEVATAGVRTFWDPVEKKCVAECAEGSVPADDSPVCRTCAQVDKNYPYWNPETGECVKKCPEQVRGSICVRAEEVNPDKPYVDPVTNESKSCSDVFPDRQYWEPNARECVKSCSDGVSPENAKTCRKCEEKEFWDGSKCASCPAWLPNWSEEQKRCLPECTDLAPKFWEGECITCAQYSFLDSESYPYWLPGVRCVGVCPDNAPVPDENDICRTCAEIYPEKPYWDGLECVSCTDDEYFDGEECAAECPP